MTDLDAKAERLNHLRQRLGKGPLSNPKKLGLTKIEACIEMAKAELADKGIAEDEPEGLPGSRDEADVRTPAQRKIDELLAGEKGCTIKHASCLLLQEVLGRREDKRTFGHTYEAILAFIQSRFANAQTSLACLRWYSVRIREGDDKGEFHLFTLPQVRPRPKR